MYGSLDAPACAAAVSCTKRRVTAPHQRNRGKNGGKHLSPSSVIAGGALWGILKFTVKKGQPSLWCAPGKSFAMTTRDHEALLPQPVLL